MSTSIVLCDVNLDDTRPNREGKISRLMERRESEIAVNQPSTSASAILEEKKEEEKSMIDVTFRMKENEMFADVKVFSFNLILSVDFLMKLSGFLQPPSAAAADDDDDELEIIQDFAFEQQNSRGTETRKPRSVQRQQSPGQEQEATKKAIFAIHIEEYDIILVEKMDDINCLALILNVSNTLRV